MFRLTGDEDTMSLDLGELERLHRAATAGLWTGGDGLHLQTFANGIPLTEESGFVDESDRDLILYLRNHLPAIIAKLKAAEKMREALAGDIDAKSLRLEGHRAGMLPARLDRLTDLSLGIVIDAFAEDTKSSMMLRLRIARAIAAFDAAGKE